MRERLKRPNRILNESRFVLGLHFKDFTFGILVFALSAKLLENTRFGILSIPITLLFFSVLVPIRLNYRPKIIRDTISYILRGEKIYDPLQK